MKRKTSRLSSRSCKISQSPFDSLEKSVAQEPLENESPTGIQNFFNDLLQHGCMCDIIRISNLLLEFKKDTKAFFDKHYEEIITLKTEYEESTDESMEIPHQVKNHLAWFAFEETARRLWEQ